MTKTLYMTISLLRAYPCCCNGWRQDCFQQKLLPCQGPACNCRSLCLGVNAQLKRAGAWTTSVSHSTYHPHQEPACNWPPTPDCCPCPLQESMQAQTAWMWRPQCP